MRLVTRVGTAMDSQGAALNEGLVARLVVASVGAFIGMYSVMTLKIGFSVETLCDAHVVSVWSSIWVLRHDVERWAQKALPLDTPDAIRTEKDGRPYRRRRLQLYQLELAWWLPCRPCWRMIRGRSGRKEGKIYSSMVVGCWQGRESESDLSGTLGVIL